MYTSKYVYQYMDTHINPMSYIQFGNIPIRDSTHSSTPHAFPAAPRSSPGRVGGGVGRIPYVYVSILDLRYGGNHLYV